MQITITKISETLEIDFAALPEVSREHVIKYGLTQILSDAAASISVKNGAKTDEAKALVMKKLDALRDGTIRVMGTRVGDPIKARAIELCIEMTIKGQFKKLKKEYDAKLARTMAIALVERNAAYTHLAEKQLEDEKKLAADLAVEEELFAELEKEEAQGAESTALVAA